MRKSYKKYSTYPWWCFDYPFEDETKGYWKYYSRRRERVAIKKDTKQQICEVDKIN